MSHPEVDRVPCAGPQCLGDRKGGHPVKFEGALHAEAGCGDSLPKGGTEPLGWEG